MSILLRFQKGSLTTQVALKDEALPDLLSIISKYQSDELPPTPPTIAMASSPATQLSILPNDDPIGASKGWLSSHGASEVLNLVRWKKNPEKILLLGALHEANNGGEGWKSSDIAMRFSEAKEPLPGNFGRDITTAVKSAFLTTVTPRTYKVSRTGWNRIAEVIQKLENH